MATKADLEAEVEQLKSQLANQNPDLAAIVAELNQLKVDLDGVSDERDQMSAALGDALAKLQSQDSSMLDYKLASDAQIAQLQAQIDELNKSSGVTCDGTHVSLDGVLYDIVWRSTVRDLCVEGYMKRNVAEDHTAVVVRKSGG